MLHVLVRGGGGWPSVEACDVQAQHLAVALGGDRLADVGTLRAEPGVFGPVATDPTVSRLVGALAAAGPKALSAIRTSDSRPRTNFPGRRGDSSRVKRPATRLIRPSNASCQWAGFTL
ncbi:hypothetical protein A4V12_11805 [Streptomyces noursei]|nr:hypothetical protein A4V12_11805 [Streptomyces noursei]